MAVINLFPIQIYKSKIIPSEKDYKISIDYLNEVFSRCKKNCWSGESGFSTGEYGLNLHSHKEFEWLFRSLYDHVFSYWNFLQYTPHASLRLNHSWANIHEYGESTKEHSHSDGYHGYNHISGVFYLKKTELESSIYFCNPLDYIHRLQPTEKLNGDDIISSPLETEQFDFILFPSWLRHKVPPSQSSNSRIAISFNYVGIF